MFDGGLPKNQFATLYLEGLAIDWCHMKEQGPQLLRMPSTSGSLLGGCYGLPYNKSLLQKSSDNKGRIKRYCKNYFPSYFYGWIALHYYLHSKGHCFSCKEVLSKRHKFKTFGKICMIEFLDEVHKELSGSVQANTHNLNVGRKYLYGGPRTKIPSNLFCCRARNLSISDFEVQEQS